MAARATAALVKYVLKWVMRSLFAVSFACVRSRLPVLFDNFIGLRVDLVFFGL